MKAIRGWTGIRPHESAVTTTHNLKDARQTVQPLRSSDNKRVPLGTPKRARNVFHMDLTRFQHDQLNCARPKQKSHCFRGKLIRRRAFLRTLPTYFNIGSHPEISEYHNSVNDGH